MKVFIHWARGLDHQRERALLISSGLKKHGINATIGNSANSQYDLIVCWGQRTMNMLKPFAKDILMMERAYFEDRFHYTSLAFNGLNGKGNFINKNSPPDRWNTLFNDGRLLPWSSGDYILITTQIIGDASLTGITVDYNKIADTLMPLGIPVKVRYHPGSKTRPGSKNLIKRSGVGELPYSESLLDQIKNAKALVTISSNTGVDAILAGTPVLNYSDYSMVWDIAMKDPMEIANPPFPDRTQWCYDMSYTQWSPEEIKNGDAWEHLKKYYG